MTFYEVKEQIEEKIDFWNNQQTVDTHTRALFWWTTASGLYCGNLLIINYKF